MIALDVFSQRIWRRAIREDRACDEQRSDQSERFHGKPEKSPNSRQGSTGCDGNQVAGDVRHTVILPAGCGTVNPSRRPGLGDSIFPSPLHRGYNPGMRRPLLGLPVFETVFAVILALIVLFPLAAWIKSLF